MVDSEASGLSGSEQVKSEQETSLNESELRLAQLQHQLPSNEPGALMHLVEDLSGEDEEDEDTRECKKLFRTMKFYLSREVSLIFSVRSPSIIFFLFLLIFCFTTTKMFCG